MWNFKSLFAAPKTPEAETLPSGHAKVEGHIGHRRSECYWEPIFNPNLELDTEPWDWNLQRDAGPQGRFVSGIALQERVTPGDTYKVGCMTFGDCDFQGSFHPNAFPMFENFKFIGCDFAYSKWHGAHFKSCAFIDCSLSLCKFEGCDFRECTWEHIGFASKTELDRTFISNPSLLIQNMISKTNPRDTTLKHTMNQWFRLQGTRAHVLRSIMISHQTTGDECTYYEAVRLHELQRSKAKMAQNFLRSCS